MSITLLVTSYFKRTFSFVKEVATVDLKTVLGNVTDHVNYTNPGLAREHLD